MIDEKKIADLQKAWKNWPHKENASFSDAIYGEMLNTIETLLKENAELKEKAETLEDSSLDAWESDGGEVGC